MSRQLAVLVLCALAASATAVQTYDDAFSLEGAFKAMVEEVAQSLEAEVEELLAEANRHHAAATFGDDLTRENALLCLGSQFDGIVKVGSRAMDLIYRVNTIAANIQDALNKCGNSITSIICKGQKLKAALDEVLALKDKVTDAIDVLKKTVEKYKECVNPGTVAPENDQYWH